MIKLKNVNKYFNKDKCNELHVLNNLNLSFDDKGLVVLLGDSGCGKTTLLNIISGLDGIDDGYIEFKQYTFSKYNNAKWDYIRNRHIGFIFQNFNLINSFTVFENIEFVLRQIGYNDDVYINDRITSILKSINLFKYRFRVVSKLSGGQQQRVAIARAIIKNPDVIIADEPTGNLDSKTTKLIMTIIKELSLDTLVLLVTHDENIARIYGDRILRMKDGSINYDSLSQDSGNLHINDLGNEIYLDQLEQSKIQFDNLNINVFSDELLDKKNIILNVIEKDNKYYIDATCTTKIVKYINDDSDVKLLLEKDIETSIENEYSFQFDSIDSKFIKITSPFSCKNTVIQSFNNFKTTVKKSKLLLIVFGFCGFMIAYSLFGVISILNSTSNFETNSPKGILSVLYNKNTDVDNELISRQELTNLKDLGIIDGYLYSDIDFSFVYPSYNQLYIDSEFDEFHRQSIAIDINTIVNDDIIYGNMPSNSSEVLIDKKLVDMILYPSENSELNQYAIKLDSYKDMLNVKIYNTSSDYPILFNIVGIVDNKANAIYGDENFLAAQYISEIIPIDLVKDDFEITMGRVPNNINEIMISDKLLIDYIDENGEFIPGNIVYSTSSSEEILLSVVGFYKINSNNILFSDSSEYYNDLFYNMILGKPDTIFSSHSTSIIDEENNEYIYVYSTQNTITNTITSLEKFGYTVTYDYQNDLDAYYSTLYQSAKPFIIILIVVILIIALCFLFVTYSILLLRLKETITYRILGVSKIRIVFFFTIEIFMLITFSAAIGYGLFIYFFNGTSMLTWGDSYIISIMWWEAIAGLLGLYSICIIAGSIPLFLVLRKKPAELLVKYEF